VLCLATIVSGAAPQAAAEVSASRWPNASSVEYRSDCQVVGQPAVPHLGVQDSHGVGRLAAEGLKQGLVGMCWSRRQRSACAAGLRWSEVQVPQSPQAEPSEGRGDGGEGSLKQPDDVPQVLPVVVEVRGRASDAGSQASDGLAGTRRHWGGPAWGCEA